MSPRKYNPLFKDLFLSLSVLFIPSHRSKCLHANLFPPSKISLSLSLSLSLSVFFIDTLVSIEGMASPSHRRPWIEAEKLKLRHIIGRDLFGEIWLATYNQSTDDYDDHEVAVKILWLIHEAFSDRFGDLFSKCQGVRGVCWLHGISVLSGKICIVMKLYEGSVGDKMARSWGGNLTLPDVLRYGIDLAQGIEELHSREILVLNLKPSNVLLNEEDQAVLGDFGILYRLAGIPLSRSNMARSLGTPNYMAPEQWHPEVIGPISFETDSWGFGCTIVEMLTGVQPWRGKSIDEIFHFVVRKQEKPCIPNGLPPQLENVLNGCFEYDLRNRPLMTDILHVFQSVRNTIKNYGSWEGLRTRSILEKSSNSGYTEWFLRKDHLQVGDTVRYRKPPNSCKPENMEVPEGTIVGLDRDTDKDGFVLLRVPGIDDPLTVRVSTLERVTFGLAAGDWVRLKEEDKKHSPVGIIHSIKRNGTVAAGFIGMETLWKGSSSEFQMAESHCVGQFVRLKANVLNPRFEWPRKRGGFPATGRIWRILPSGCLIVKFPGILTFKVERTNYLADPAEVEVVTFNTCPGIVKKYQHLEDFHWAVRPLLITLGLVTAMRVRSFVGKKMGVSKAKKQRSPLDWLEWCFC